MTPIYATKGIKEGIYNLIQPVVDNVHFMLDTVNTQFTVGVYLDEYASLTEGNSKGIIVISDKLEKTFLLDKELLLQLNVSGEQFSIQTAIRQSFNDSLFIKHDYILDGNSFTIICAPMSLACNEDYTINLKIFNSVISNWIYRYNECINNRLMQG